MVSGTVLSYAAEAADAYRGTGVCLTGTVARPGMSALGVSFLN